MGLGISYPASLPWIGCINTLQTKVDMGSPKMTCKNGKYGHFSTCYQKLAKLFYKNPTLIKRNDCSRWKSIYNINIT